jgi:outer membrane protein assembly factor BamA
LGRGEILSFNFGAGNRQQSFQLTFQEPYFRDRPINVGFSLFARVTNFSAKARFFRKTVIESNKSG